MAYIKSLFSIYLSLPWISLRYYLRVCIALRLLNDHHQSHSSVVSSVYFFWFFAVCLVALALCKPQRQRRLNAHTPAESCVRYITQQKYKMYAHYTPVFVSMCVCVCARVCVERGKDVYLKKKRKNIRIQRKRKRKRRERERSRLSAFSFSSSRPYLENPRTYRT